MNSSTENGAISEKATQIFVHHPHLKRRKLHCRAVNKKLVLEGEVQSFFEKQLAQEALRELEGVELENQITVNRS